MRAALIALDRWEGPGWMNLYLMRHAHAAERDEWSGPDAERPLIEKGRRAALAAATGLSRLTPPISRILTSPYARAAETAAIVARRLDAPHATTDALTPGFDLARLAETLDGAGWASDLLLVGHEPDLSGVVSALTGQPAQSLKFKKAAVALVSLAERSDARELAGAGSLTWLLTWRKLERRDGS